MEAVTPKSILFISYYSSAILYVSAITEVILFTGAVSVNRMYTGALERTTTIVVEKTGEMDLIWITRFHNRKKLNISSTRVGRESCNVLIVFLKKNKQK